MKIVNLNDTPVVTNTKLEGLSDKYSLVNTKALIDIAERQGFVVHSIKYPRNSKTGSHGRHLIRLDVPGFSNIDTKSERPQLIIDNSHDGTSSLRIMAGVFRLVCSNGLIAGNSTMNYRLRHVGLKQEEIERHLEIAAKQVFNLLPKIEALKAVQYTPEQATAFAKEALIRRAKASGLNDSEINSMLNLNLRLGVDNFNRMLNTRRYEDKELNLWTVFNRIQENSVKNSGLMYIDADGKYRRLYGVNSIAANTKLNQELWELAESQLKEVA